MTQTARGSDLPLIDDFSESSLLDQITTGEEETPEEIEAREKQEKEEAEKLAEDEEKVAKEEEEAEKIRLAKEQEEELTDEEKEAKAKAEEEKAKEGSFWDDVETITGNKYEVDYGDIEPDTPEGAAIREKVVSETAVEANLSFLEEKFPDGFKALMHVSNGGKLKDLAVSNEIDYSSLDIKEENIEAQKSFMEDYYMSKGFSEAKAKRNVEDDEDSEEGLFKNFEVAFKEKKEEQETSKADIFKKQEDIKLSQDKQDKQFGENLSSVINEGKIGNFTIPKAEAGKFYDHVLSHVKREGDGYAISIPLDNNNFQEQLQQLFFGFKKGDLSKYVSKAASTESTRRLKKNMSKEKDGTEGASEKDKREFKQKLPTLGIFETDET